MIETKAFEIRDRATLIPVIATRLQSADEQENWLMRRAGFSGYDAHVILCRMDCPDCNRSATYDPHGWGGGARTLPVAHQYIWSNWDDLSSGSVIDVEFILNETQEAKTSERFN